MNLNNILLKDATIYLNKEFIDKDILIEDGIIKAIEDNITTENAKIIDCSNKLVTPSFIDVHVHLRTPGFEYKEDLVSGSKAALKGGYSHLFSMPNTNPCLDDFDIIASHIKDIEAKSLVKVFPFSAISKKLAGKELVDIEKIAKLNIGGFSDDGKGLQDDNLMKEALIKAGQANRLISAHCEDEDEFDNGIGSISEGKTAQKSGLKTINNKSEYAMIARDLKIIDEIHNIHNYQYHVCHISTKESLDLIKEAKANNHNVSCEVTPHHLISSEEEIDVNNANYKMNPPLRSKADRDYLVAGLNDKSIEIIATDHAPHSFEEKQKSFENAPFGIIGLELAFSLLNTHLVKTNKVKLETILDCLIDNPTRIFKIDKKVAINEKAYFNIIDLDKEVVYTKDNVVSKSSNTFYLDTKLHGKIEKVIFEDKLYEY